MAPAPPPAPRRPAWHAVLIAAALAGACFAVYANTIGGEFVYDDNRQIEGNTLVQEPRFFWRALASDVWSFKGSSPTEIGSNYWRPTFVLWLIVNHRAFGLAETAGWHLSSISLHALATVLAFALALRLGLPLALAAGAGLVFAVHPVHVESVAWVSGSPDLLLAAGLLGSLLCVLGAEDRRARDGGRAGVVLLHAAALTLYAAAQLAKEAAALFPVLVFLAVATGPGGTGGQRLRRAAAVAGMFLLVGAAWFIARMVVIRGVAHSDPGGTSVASMFLSVPEVGAFYLRQTFFPYWIAPQYPLRPVAPGELGAANFHIPLAVCAAAGIAALAVARGGAARGGAGGCRRVAVIGVALFALPLAPAFNIRAFPPDQIVHDRYLYLPLLGALLMVGAGAMLVLRPSRRAGWTLIAGIAALCVPLALQTLDYNRAWLSNVSLWERGVRGDPGSASANASLGVSLMQAGRGAEAREALQRAAAISPIRQAYQALAKLNIDDGRYDEAATCALHILHDYPGYYPAHELLAVSYERQGRLDDAAAALRAARTLAPARACTLTESLSVVLRQQGRHAEAIAELESVRAAIPGELSPGAPMVLYRLGLLYLEAGHLENGERAMNEYLEVTRALDDQRTRDTRRQVIDGLARLKDYRAGSP